MSTLRPWLLASAALGVALGAQVALAQTAAPPSAPVTTAGGLPTTTSSADPAALPALTAPTSAPGAQGPGQAKEVIVTGSRITSAGFRAPTPTQVLGAAEIAKNAEPNVFTTIAELPSLQGSSGTSVNTFSTSSGLQGLSSFSLRGLGVIRTLTLLDGQRVVGANVTGVTDISEFPQLLISRVDVVTGGASASYGSDAVGGVVNFITNKKFEGVKANIEGGLTTYGDDGQALVQIAAGHGFLDNKLHVEGSFEFDHEGGVPAGGFGEQGSDGRTWYVTPTFFNRGVTNDGSPQYIVGQHAQAYQYGKYGLITAGPLQGTAFNAAGQPFPFVYGSNGVPARNAAGTVNGCYSAGGFCVGGDLSGNTGIGVSLQSALQRIDGYTRIGYDLNANNEVYATVNIADVQTQNQPNPGANKTGLTLQCSNPFVSAVIQQECAADGITSFKYGLSNAILPNIQVTPDRTQFRFVFGGDGHFDVFGKTWSYDGYYEHGTNYTDLNVHDILLTPHYNAAIQAISLNGQTVCASATARAAGCVPINIIGGAPLSAAQLAYVVPGDGPFQHTVQTQDVASLNFSGEPVSLWAGPVSLAFGGEYRREYYRVNADVYGNGVAPGSSYSSAYPQDPTVATTGANWYAGNYHNGHGAYDVGEAFVETNVPFIDTPQLGRANLNAAARWTDYSTSGVVWTWKVGGTWETPIPWIRLRAVTSRDVRAPNLSELFAAPVSINVPNFTNPFNGTSVTISQITTGNINLKPEVARNTEAGIIFSRVPHLGAFSFSLDYYRIQINNEISTLGAQDQVNYCHAGITQLCGSFYLNDPTNSSNYVDLQPFNLASVFTDGFDLEASDTFVRPFGLPGRLTTRALATNVRNFISNTGLPGAVPVQQAGVDAGATPSWKLLAIQSWDADRWSFLVQERWFSDGSYGSQYVVCGAGTCPVSTNNNPTITSNSMEGAIYLDIGGTYNITPKLVAYGKIDNLLNRDPTPSPQTNTGYGVNPALYDLVGRFYHFGLRYNF